VYRNSHVLSKGESCNIPSITCTLNQLSSLHLFRMGELQSGVANPQQAPWIVRFKAIKSGQRTGGTHLDYNSNYW
jgi:hypothetical protein